METDLFEKHLNLVIEANKTTNITRIDSFESGMVLHVEDSLVGLKEMENAPAGLYGDMGTGAGFPGIPLAIATNRRTMLIESVGKKAAILESFIIELNLEDRVITYSGRLEDLALTQRGAFSVLTARALSALSCLMELASPLLREGGHLICYKANVSSEEWEHALGLQETLALYLVSDRELTLSDGVTHRRIIVFEKQGKPIIKLPRHVGFAQKKPL